MLRRHSKREANQRRGGRSFQTRGVMSELSRMQQKLMPASSAADGRNGSRRSIQPGPKLLTRAVLGLKISMYHAAAGFL